MYKRQALEHAGLTEADVTFVHVKLDRDDGRLEYEVEFYKDNTEYDYDIDANTGEILSLSLIHISPEHFARISQVDTMKRKQFVKGMEQIAQEGAIQIFKELGGGMEEVIVGVVGVLQFEVLEYRLKNEYNVDIRRNDLSYSYIRWIENEDLDPKTLNLTSDTRRVEDFKGRRLLLFTSPWNIDWALEHNEGLRLSEVGR